MLASPTVDSRVIAMLSCDLLMPYQAITQQRHIPAMSLKGVTCAVRPLILHTLVLGDLLLLRPQRRGMAG
jgi:hypothetical protein